MDVSESVGQEESNKDGGSGANICVTCQQPTSNAHFCKLCKKSCHSIAPCSIGPAIVCVLCDRRQRTQDARSAAKRQQQAQADKMKTKSAQRFEPAEVGQTVMVPVPEVDRGRADHRNVKAVVMAVEDGFYRLGTMQGMLRQLYARNQFRLCVENFISIDEVPKEKEITVREVARCDSVGTGQGFFKCGCTQKCQDKKCKCYKSGVKCNSKCHSSSACCNK